MKKNDFVLPILIILLCFFVPCTIYGVSKRFEEGSENANPNHLPKVGDVLYFYDDTNTLVGTYKCNNEECNAALTTVEDAYLNYYQGDKNEVGIVLGTYVFVQDGEDVVLYNLLNSQAIAKMRGIKNYGAAIAGNHLITKDENNKYGLLDLNEIRYTIETKYDFIGLANKISNNEISTDKLVVLENGSWYLMSLEEEKISSGKTDPIHDFDDKYIYYINRNGNYYIASYEGETLFNDSITKYLMNDDYRVIFTINSELRCYNSDYTKLIKTFNYTSQYIDFSLNGSILTVKDENGAELDTVDLTSAGDFTS